MSKQSKTNQTKTKPAANTPETNGSNDTSSGDLISFALDKGRKLREEIVKAMIEEEILEEEQAGMNGVSYQ